MGLVVARGPLFVQHQFGLNVVKVFLRDQGRNGAREGPLLPGRRVLAPRGFPQGARRRASDTSRTRAFATRIDLTRIGGIREEAMQGGRAPSRIATRGLDAELPKILG